MLTAEDSLRAECERLWTLLRHVLEETTITGIVSRSTIAEIRCEFDVRGVAR